MAVPAEAVRVGDAERERVRAQLQQHAADGRLTLDELSERFGEMYAARTAADLERTLRDLPALPAGALPRPPVERQRVRSSIRGALATAALLLTIWAVVGVTAGSWYFWPVWPLAFIGFGVARRVRGTGEQRQWGGCASGWGRRGPGRAGGSPA